MHAERDEPSVPLVHALHLVELARRRGVTSSELLRGTGLVEAELSDPGGRLGVSSLVRLVERARSLTREPALGIYFGLRMQAASHGYLGFAAMTASTLGEALDLATRFAPTLTTAFSLRAWRRGDSAALVIDEESDLGPARDAVMIALLVGLWRIGCTLAGAELRGRAELAMPEPAYFARFRGALPEVRFGQPAHQLVFEASVLDAPLVSADPAALRLASAACERAIEALGAEASVVGRVRASVLTPAGARRSLDEVARRMRVSPRTLKRRLEDAGTTFSTLRDEALRARAESMLRGSTRAIDAVAEALGFSDAANFTRAFRRWTGTTPAAFRRRAR